MASNVTSDTLQDKVSTEVVINKDDARNVRDFFKHFNIKVPENLEQVCDRIEKLPEITFPDQHDFKIALCEAMVTSDHAMFKDELFSEVIKNAEREVFNFCFKKEVEEVLDVNAPVLSAEEKKKTPAKKTPVKKKK